MVGRASLSSRPSRRGEWFPMVIPVDGGGPPVPPPNPCNAPTCLDAKAELASARTAFASTCNGLRTVAAILRVLKPIVSISLWYLLVIVIVAIVLLWLGLGWISVILWALVLAYVLAWILYLVFARVAGSMAQDLAARMKDVQDAIAKVVAQCPANCRGDLSIPTCDVQIP